MKTLSLIIMSMFIGMNIGAAQEGHRSGGKSVKVIMASAKISHKYKSDMKYMAKRTPAKESYSKAAMIKDARIEKGDRSHAVKSRDAKPGLKKVPMDAKLKNMHATRQRHTVR